MTYATADLFDRGAHLESDWVPVCEWFALCDNTATTTQPHPILGPVPICDRCKAKVKANS